MATLDFYFDFISHNAYLAWARIPALLEATEEIVVRPVPVVFGVLLKAHDQLGPAEVRPKNAWMLRDVVRKSMQYDIPINPPHAHPFNPLLPLRLVTLPDLDAQTQWQLIDTLFKATWVDRVEVSKPEPLLDYLLAQGVADAVELVDCAQRNKAPLKTNTEEALSRGVFGVPSMIFNDQLYWGFDDFEALSLGLQGQDPVSGIDLDPWYAVQASVTRKRS